MDNSAMIMAWIGVIVAAINGFTGNTAGAIAGLTILYGAIHGKAEE